MTDDVKAALLLAKEALLSTPASAYNRRDEAFDAIDTVLAAVPSSVAAPSPQNVLTYYGVFCNEEPYAAYPSRAQAEVYCSGFSKPCEIRTLSLAVPAPPSEPPATWQPIESAPRDGTRILSYQPNGAWQSARPWRGERIEVVYWHQPGNPEAEGMWVPSHRPTHWMPLPAPPSERTS